VPKKTSDATRAIADATDSAPNQALVTFDRHKKDVYSLVWL